VTAWAWATGSGPPAARPGPRARGPDRSGDKPPR